MSSGRQSIRTLPIAMKSGVAIAFVVAMVILVAHLEQHRTKRLLEEYFKLGVTEEGLIYLIRTVGPEITLQHWSFISDVPTLRTLDLSGTDFSEGGLEHVVVHQELECLILNGCRWVDDTEVAKTASLKKLKSMDLSASSITSATLASINNRQLTDLNLSGCDGITDDVVDDVLAMNSLDYIHLDDTRLSLDGFLRLKRHAPRLRVIVTADHFLRDACQVIDGRPWLTAESDLNHLVRVYEQFPRGGSSQSWNPSAETTVLSLSGPAAGDALEVLFPKFPSLTHLELHRTAIRGGFASAPSTLKSLSLYEMHRESDLSTVSLAPSLEEIYIRDSDLQPGQFESWSQRSTLRGLSISDCQFSSGDLASIGRINSLERLMVLRTTVPNWVVMVWEKMPKLRVLELTGTDVLRDK